VIVPTRSYILWFSQRVGSTVLAQMLEETGIAGRPREWLEPAAGLLGAELKRALWEHGTTDNGVLAVKYGMHAAHHRRVTELLADAGGWQAVFPRCKHVFVTRRDKVRLAISWWRAIQSGEWHRRGGAEPAASPAYDYDAIAHLVLEANVREADILAQLAQWRVVPYEVVYEELVADFAGTVGGLLRFLELPDAAVPAPALARMADDVSEDWHRRFRHDWLARQVTTDSSVGDN
jgi:LPS sulfotransferase NodH